MHSQGARLCSGSLYCCPPWLTAFAIAPQGQEVANTAGQMPQARGDLESLQRLVIEQMGAAFGVPSDLLFNGRFASKSTAQLS